MKLKYLILVVCAPSIIILDQMTKFVILRRFVMGEKLPVIPGFFDITHIHNKGAAFGMLSTLPDALRVPFFFLMPMIALGVIAVVFRKLPESSKLVSTALALVIGGAIGNLIDRVILGEVVDFLLFHWQYKWTYPAFNVADSAICVGVGLMMLDLFQHRHAENAT